MRRTPMLAFVIFLSLLGLADAWYLSKTALTGASLTCTLSGLDGCNTVAQSPYAHLFGLPLGLYGVVFYGIFLLLAALALAHPARRVERFLAALGLVGLFFSGYFLYIQLVLIKALCVYCLGSAAIALLLAGATGLLLYKARSKMLPEAPVS